MLESLHLKKEPRKIIKLKAESLPDEIEHHEEEIRKVNIIVITMRH